MTSLHIGMDIEPSLLSGQFLTPYFYSPDFVELELLLKQRKDCQTLGSLTGRTGPNLNKPTIYQGKSPSGGTAAYGRIGLIMPRMLTGGGLSDCRDFVPEGLENDFNSRRLAGGEILLLRSAHKAEYIGKEIEVYLKGEIEFVPSDTVIAIRADDKIVDPGYLVSFFRSRQFAFPQIQRRVTSQNAKITPDVLLDMLVCVPNEDLQVAIGNKVRASEKLRKDATGKLASAVNKLSACSGGIDALQVSPNADGSCDFFSNVIESNQLGLFHGAQFFSPKRTRAIAVIKATGIGARLGDHTIRVRSKARMMVGRAHIDPTNVDASNGYWSVGLDVDGGDSALASPGHILFLRMRPYLNKTTVNATDAIVSASPEFLIYEANGIDAYYICLCLRQPWALAQVAEIATGDRPRVDGDFVDEVLIPWPNTARRLEIGELFKSSFTLRRRAEELVQQSIADVENLIRGDLDEAGCIEQGKSLASQYELES
jgi:hypothetical protein